MNFNYNAPAPRTIRSFVHRARRLPDKKQANYERLLEKYQFVVAEDGFNPALPFQRPGKMVLEIGFGHAEILLEEARICPRHIFIGIEVYQPSLARVLHQIQHLKLENLRVIRGDAAALLPRFASGCIEQLRILFPDPWPKKRHWKRRLLQEPFLRECARVVSTDGILHLATDWNDYAEHIDSLLADNSDWTQLAELPKRPETHYELRAKRLGHQVREWALRREAR